MSDRHIPVRPDLQQLRNQAKDLLQEIRQGNAAALEDFRKHHPKHKEPAMARLADAQFTLARSYGIKSWPRLVLACKVVDAIWENRVDELRDLVTRHPYLRDEMARGTAFCNWGPPMSYAANLGRDQIIAMLRDLGATDLIHAMGRAVLQGQIETARKLHAMGARPPRGTVMGPAETQNAEGMKYLLDLGAELCDEGGNRLAPVAMVLETYCREPRGKHGCMELFAEHGVDLPDTPVMALHRGRLDLLEAHLNRNPQLLTTRFAHADIYPPALGCSTDEALALHAAPLAGSTLLHICIEFGELEIARRLLDRGMDVNIRTSVDADGFGGHTPLFGCVVRMGLMRTEPLARLLLDRGADPNIRVSIRKRSFEDTTVYEYRDVTVLEWGQRFHDRSNVDKPSMKLIAERAKSSG